jgi:hypothetical protein
VAATPSRPRQTRPPPAPHHDRVRPITKCCCRTRAPRNCGTQVFARRLSARMGRVMLSLEPPVAVFRAGASRVGRKSPRERSM